MSKLRYYVAEPGIGYCPHTKTLEVGNGSTLDPVRHADLLSQSLQATNLMLRDGRLTSVVQS